MYEGYAIDWSLLVPGVGRLVSEFNSRMAVTHADLEPNTGKTCLMSSKTGVFLVLVTILLGLSSFTLCLITKATRSQDHGIGFITHSWWTLVPCGQFYYYYFLHCQKILKNKIEVCAMKFNVLVTTYEFIMYDRSKLSKVDWKYIIIDEAQRMKDMDSVLARDLDRKTPNVIELTIFLSLILCIGVIIFYL
ncbi:uncharacterized protein LOC107619011 [Arachis ipaensis]|uniref:ATP-dependent helicase BRM n=1 Tax=Arachis hypogaea TaxID=3818 RepID=A0A444XI07_ARAHY|nr:uncharacterized protein LOC107619011 [Arachis ipaensis]XP_025676415.1 uncharacterized protein LOC112776464 [Arachis hypogaea]QHN77014.1 ATP-dependent helicase BRM [Arachis hypogaea]RYQ89365.1 hypothetical protein Ahy_B09g096052 [Arachis hypogaea]